MGSPTAHEQLVPSMVVCWSASSQGFGGEQPCTPSLLPAQTISSALLPEELRECPGLISTGIRSLSEASRWKFHLEDSSRAGVQGAAATWWAKSNL